MLQIYINVDTVITCNVIGGFPQHM